MFFLILCCVAGVAGGETGISIVTDGLPCACIELPEETSETLRWAYHELTAYTVKRTGAHLPLCNKESGADLVRIHLGQTQRVRKMRPMPGGMADDGFVIQVPDGKTVIIVGPTDDGTLFGVYAFLERFVGVRWLFPGPLGEDIPKEKNLSIPMVAIREDPVFFSRQMSGFPNTIQKKWANRMRLKGHVAFHHNLNRIIPPETYTKTHPEFFPIINGKRYLPPNNRTHGWQPCFSAQGIVSESIKTICHYFENNPNRKSFSLGINDFGGFCETDLSVSKSQAPRNFVGYVDLSDIYFKWANAVVDGVLQHFPDKRFGCLAYDNILEAPKAAPVHPRMIPFMTYDRVKWIHKPTQQVGHTVTKAWDAKTERLGWYDYIYGSVYHVPRIYFHKMAEYLRFGAANGVSELYAEACPNWGEGPKLYVAAKLFWNPDIDVDATLQEWYERAVGKTAAPYLSKYYRIWESFWTDRILKTAWFTPRGQFLHFWLPDYLELVTFEDIEKSRALLETVIEKAGTRIQRKRAELLLKAFEYYEASALSYLGLIKGFRQPGKDEDDYRMMHRKRKELVDEFDQDPVLVHPIRFDRKFSWAEMHPFNVVDY